MPNDNSIGAHGIERDRRIDKGFTFFYAGLRGMHIDDIGPHAFARNLKRQQRAGAIFKKGIDDRQAIQTVGMFAGLAVQIDPLFGLFEEK